MKHLVTIAFISTCIFASGQSEMFWNNYSNFNPAMSGFQYKLHGSATYTDYYPSLSGNYSAVNANYGMKIAHHHGVGITYNGDFIHAIKNNKVLLNYNYQLNLKKAGRLSIGTGLGVGQSTVDYDKLTFGDSIVHPSSAASFELNVGLAYKWKNLYIGISATNLTPKEQHPLSSYYRPRTGYNLHVQYAFQITRKLQLTPRVLYTSLDGFHRLQPNLTLSYNEQFHLGVSSKLWDKFGVNAGFDIKNKLRVSYMFSKTISKLSSGISSGVHEFSIGYTIKNRRQICGLSGTPDF
jgi:type IX secretion system PorP/SprF family membrane protein